ncbi:MAG: dTDP-4-dehydrorhamnose reductase [Azovibrio sp.]
MKILLTGKDGQVGFELQRTLACLGEVCAAGHEDCDLADEAALRQLVREVKPDVIVNPAAYTAVDKAESDLDLAHAVNARAPAILGEEALRLGAWVIHFSTDYVFEGTGQNAYTEQDVTNPQNAYGKTKREGELALQASGADHLIFRTSWVVGVHGGNFAKTMLRLAQERENLTVVADQFGVPTSAALLADVTALMIHQVQREGKAGFPFGLYHLVPEGETNWCEYARFVIEEALRAGKPLKSTPESIQAIQTSQYPTPAKRPLNSRLDTRLFRETFGLRLPPWQEGVRHILKQIL